MINKNNSNSNNKTNMYYYSIYTHICAHNIIVYMFIYIYMIENN